MAIKAISPKEARAQYDPMSAFPECIIKAINEIIIKRVNSLPANQKSFKLHQKEVFEAIDKAIKEHNDNKSPMKRLWCECHIIVTLKSLIVNKDGKLV